jgi:hypothetical protein
VDCSCRTKIKKLQKFQNQKKILGKLKIAVYVLTGNLSPLSRTIKSTDIYYWFDEEKGYERELKYCDNQKTVAL